MNMRVTERLAGTFWLVWFLMFLPALKAQGDTTLGYSLHLTAGEAYASGEYEQAATTWQAAAIAYRDAAWPRGQARCLLRSAENFVRISRFDLGAALTDQAAELLASLPEPPVELAARVFANRGLLGIYQGNTEASQEEYQQAVALLQPGGPSPLLASCYNDLGVVAGILGSFEEELAWYEKTLEIQLDLLGPGDPELAATYNNIGTAYYRIGDYASMDTYLRKAEQVLRSSMGDDHIYMSTLYNNLAYSSRLNENYDEALRYYFQALEQQLAAYGNKHVLITVAYNNIGTTYGLLGDRPAQKKYLQKSLRLRLELYGPDHNDVALSHQNLGFYYLEGNNPAQALLHFREAFRIRRVLFGDRHPELANSYLALAEFFQSQGQQDSALHYCRAALRANRWHEQAATTELPPLDNSFSYPILLETLLRMAAVHEAQAESTTDPSALQQALQLYQHADSLVWRRREGMVDPQGPAYLGRETRPLYEGGIRVAATLLATNGNSGVQEAMFKFLARSRAGMLWEAWQAEPVRLAFGVPDSSWQREQRLREAMGQAEQALSLAATDSARQLAEDSLFVLREQWRHYLEMMTDQFPGYMTRRFERPRPVLADLKAALSTPEETLIAFFLGDNRVYQVGLREDQVKCFDSPMDESVRQAFQQVLASLRDASQAASGVEPVSVRKAQIHLYQVLLQALLTDMEVQPGDPLTIVPDAALGYLPFESLLLTDGQGDTVRLGDRHPIRYQYSLVLPPWAGRRARNIYAGFAPDYAQTDSSPYRAAFRPLQRNADEVQAAIAALEQGSAWMGPLASEAVFKAQAGKFAILHLAMHGKLNDEHPLESFLAFGNPAPDSLEDGRLHAYEISQLDLRADLALLSACETGTGALQAGEGIMSMARAFREAGCRSVIMTLWPVNDAATYEMMQRFFQFWEEGNNSSESLQLAKRALREETRFRHPHFWAGFVLVGESLPRPQTRPRWPWAVAGLLLAVAVMGIYSWRRRRASSAAA